jgi:hypothetical protein
VIAPWTVYRLDFGHRPNGGEPRLWIIVRIADGVIEMHTNSPGYPLWLGDPDEAERIAASLNAEVLP